MGIDGYHSVGPLFRKVSQPGKKNQLEPFFDNLLAEESRLKDIYVLDKSRGVNISS